MEGGSRVGALIFVFPFFFYVSPFFFGIGYYEGVGSSV